MGKHHLEFLKMLLLIGSEDIEPEQVGNRIRFLNLGGSSFEDAYDQWYMGDLVQLGFLSRIQPHERSTRFFYRFSKDALPILRQEAFKEID